MVNAARKDDKYWITDAYSQLGVIKNALEKKIKTELTENSKVAIFDIVTFLCNEYGFIPSSLYSFLTGFLLKEYADETYRLSDEANNEKMNTERMKGAVDEAFKQIYAPSTRYRDKFIRIMSPEEQLFCDLMGDVFDIPDNQCGSVEDVIKRVRIKEKTKGLPAWALMEKASGIEVDFITEFAKLLNPQQGLNISAISGNIGKLVNSDKALADKLETLLTDENRRDAMKSYLSVFEDGILLSLAKAIGAEDKVVGDIQKHFGNDTEGLWLWSKETGEGQIRKVIREYEFIKKSNELLIRHNSSVADALSAWQEKLKFVKISHDIIETPDFTPFTSILYNVAKGAGRDYLKEFYNCLTTHGETIVVFLKSDKDNFAKSCAFQLQGLSEQEIGEVYKSIPNDCFILNKQGYLQKIQQIVESYKNNMARLQLRELWKEKTGTDYPYEWSSKYKTPLLVCVPANKWTDCKRAFDAVNRSNPGDAEVKFALEFLTANPIWDDITNQEKIDNAFKKTILGNFKTVLTDLNEVREHLAKYNISPYDWSGHSEITRLIRELAQSKYSQEPYERVVKRIDSMDGEKLKTYLKRLVKGNMVVGIEILEAGEEG